MDSVIVESGIEKLRVESAVELYGEANLFTVVLNGSVLPIKKIHIQCLKCHDAEVAKGGSAPIFRTAARSCKINASNLRQSGQSPDSFSYVIIAIKVR